MMTKNQQIATALEEMPRLFRKPLWEREAKRGSIRSTLLAVMIAASLTMTINLFSHPAFGQASSSSDASGKVTDPTGATIPGATIHLINNATGAERTATTNDNGDWSVPNLPPASYKVRVEKEGFKVSQIPALDVEIGKTANGSVTLEVGGSTETVEVSTLPPQLQTSEATVGQVIDQKQINDLPLNGRNVLQLATLAPGVSPPQTSNTGAPAQVGTRNLFITVDGGRGSSTNYVLDGTYIRSVRFNNMSIQPNTDTIQEFNLLRSTFGTEYGQGIAVVSMVTKSGANQIHGTAYEFARNAIFDARNFFTTYKNSPNKPDFSRHQFGATLGLPIVKDKYFIFGGYEGLRTNQPTQLFAVFPTQAQLHPTTLPAGTPYSQLATALAPYFPVPNGTYSGGNYTTNGVFVDNYDQYTIRADQTLSQRNSLFERYVDFNASQSNPQVVGGAQTNPLIGRNAVVGNTFLITPNLVNEVRIGYNEFYNITLATLLHPEIQWAAAEGLTNVTALTSPTQNGRAAVTITPNGSTGDGAGDQGGKENVISIGDSLSWVHGKHTFKFGFQGQNRRVWQITDNNSRGSFTFSACTVTICGASNTINPVTGVAYTAYENFARGFCTSACNGNAGTSLGHYRDNTYGLFASDVWQFGHGLTLNLGVRWEYNEPWIEQNGLEGSFDPSANKIRFSKLPANIPAAYLPYIDSSTTYRKGIVDPQRMGIMPRIGIAYQVNPAIVFRAGFGVYLDNLNTNELQFTRYAPPLYSQQAFNGVFVNTMFPNPAASTQIPTPFSIAPNNGRPYTQEWNASAQINLAKGTIMELAYTGSNSHRLWKRYDQNMDELQPGYVGTGSNPAGQGIRPFPQFGHGMLTSVTRGDSSFNGGSIKVEKRTSSGLYALGSYQWAKNLDNSSGEAGSNDASYASNFAFDRSYSNFDVRHRAVISGGYTLPLGKGHAWLNSGIGNALAGGWSFQPAIQFRSGYPFNVTRSGQVFSSYMGARVNLAPGRTLASAVLPHPKFYHFFDPTAFVDPGPTFQGNVTRNSLHGPGTASVDFSGIKDFHIYERLRVQFRAEAFNIINHPIFAQPAGNISTTTTVGQISATSSGLSNRSIQLAVKAIW
ncbi:MAG TPA: TonB-dependent receptor [Granulicella sp.]